MAEEYLGINDSTLQSVADAIKSKAGIASSTKLAFPAGFKSALQGIDAYAPATKVAASTKTLTPSSTSYSIPAGVHTGNGKVRIRTRNTGLKVNGVATDSNTITPSSVEQVVLPTGTYFLQTIYVDAMNASGYYQVQTGTLTFPTPTKNISISGFSFTPVGFAIMLHEYGSSSSSNKLSTITSILNGKGSSPTYTSGTYQPDATGAVTNVSSCMAQGSVTVNGNQIANSPFYGTYFYMIWGN